ncbi:hypothetical protein [Streptomyces sp. NBC_01589]
MAVSAGDGGRLHVSVLAADDTLRAVDREGRRIRWAERAPYALHRP